MRSTWQFVHVRLGGLPQPIALRQDIQNGVTIADDLFLVGQSNVIVAILVDRHLFTFVQQVVHFLVINFDVTDAGKINKISLYNLCVCGWDIYLSYRIINVRSDSFSSNNCRTASAVMPGSSSLPIIVWVLPGKCAFWDWIYINFWSLFCTKGQCQSFWDKNSTTTTILRAVDVFVQLWDIYRYRNNILEDQHVRLVLDLPAPKTLTYQRNHWALHLREESNKFLKFRTSREC